MLFHIFVSVWATEQYLSCGKWGRSTCVCHAPCRCVVVYSGYLHVRKGLLTACCHLHLHLDETWTVATPLSTRVEGFVSEVMQGKEGENKEGEDKRGYEREQEGSNQVSSNLGYLSQVWMLSSMPSAWSTHSFYTSITNLVRSVIFFFFNWNSYTSTTLTMDALY